MFTLTEDELQMALQALEKYYGITDELLPDSLYRNTVATLSIRCLWDTETLLNAFDTIGDRANYQQLIKTLEVLTSVMLESPRLQGTLRTKELFDKMRLRDYLRLYVLATSTHDGDEITVRSKCRSVRFNNYSNWIVKELLEPFLSEKLSGMENLEEAIAALDELRPVKKGRRPGDPRVGILLWGTYQMLSDELPLKSPMPNNLCNFLITLLQIQKVLPDSPIIDAFWIRAQLRYIRSRPEKPRFPITD